MFLLLIKIQEFALATPVTTINEIFWKEKSPHGLKTNVHGDELVLIIANNYTILSYHIIKLNGSIHRGTGMSHNFPPQSPTP